MTSTSTNVRRKKDDSKKGSENRKKKERKKYYEQPFVCVYAFMPIYFYWMHTNNKHTHTHVYTTMTRAFASNSSVNCLWARYVWVCWCVCLFLFRLKPHNIHNGSKKNLTRNIHTRARSLVRSLAKQLNWILLNVLCHFMRPNFSHVHVLCVCSRSVAFVRSYKCILLLLKWNRSQRLSEYKQRESEKETKRRKWHDDFIYTYSMPYSIHI